MPSNVSRCRRRSRRTVATGAGVERGQRLVEQQQSRVRGERTGQAPRVAPARPTTPAVARSAYSREPDPIDPLAGAFGGRSSFGRLAGAQPEGDVLEHGHVVEQQVVLEHEPDRAILGFDERVGRRLVDDEPVDRRSGRRRSAPARQGIAAPCSCPTRSVRATPAARRAARRARPADRASRAAGRSAPTASRRERPRSVRSTRRASDRGGRASTANEIDVRQQSEHDRLLRIGLEREIDRERHRLRRARESCRRT